ncbi:MAG: leucine-rich repeat domain-containing protein [Ruminococcus sp.]|nr:leucine-rich repeat domain-containing protein [Ruminococcus sp.]
MPFVEAKCTNCGAVLPVDNTRDAWICNYCNTPFIVEKAINNYNVTNNITANTVNIFGGRESDFVIRGGVLEKYTGESTDVVIPDNVVRVGEKVFRGLPITSVKIPDSVKEISRYAFSDCTYLKSVIIPNSVTNISGAFRNCTSLTFVTIPSGITDISDAFQNCTSLTSVTIPNSVIDISGAFWGCTSLTYVTIPNSVTDIGGAFIDCKSLKSVTIPNSVKDISAFSGCTSLTSVTIPNSVERIFGHEFKNCYNLVDINWSHLSEYANFFPAIAKRKEEGLCIYCGGKLSFLKKCKSCGRKN